MGIQLSKLDWDKTFENFFLNFYSFLVIDCTIRCQKFEWRYIKTIESSNRQRQWVFDLLHFNVKCLMVKLHLLRLLSWLSSTSLLQFRDGLAALNVFIILQRNSDLRHWESLSSTLKFYDQVIKIFSFKTLHDISISSYFQVT